MMDDAAAKSLISAIISTAARDYFKLRECADKKRRVAPVFANMPELTQFFESSWGRKLLAIYNLKGKDVLATMKRRYEDGSYKQALYESAGIHSSMSGGNAER